MRRKVSHARKEGPVSALYAYSANLVSRVLVVSSFWSHEFLRLAVDVYEERCLRTLYHYNYITIIHYNYISKNLHLQFFVFN